MADPPGAWLLSFGHRVPMLEHERPDELPRRARMCETCGRPRPIESPAQREGELVCVECGRTSDDGAGWRAALAPDDAGIDELEVPVYCPACWQGEFGNGLDA